MSTDNIKTALKMMPYGFYALTSRNGDEVNIMVANWITQVSFEPRLVAIGLQKTSYTHGVIEKGEVFTINIFKKEDAEIMDSFTKSRAKNPDKVNNATFEAAPETGCPVIDRAAAYIEFKLREILDVGGDYDIVVGEAVNAGILKDAEVDDVLTLPYLGWSYAG